MLQERSFSVLLPGLLPSGLPGSGNLAEELTQDGVKEEADGVFSVDLHVFVLAIFKREQEYLLVLGGIAGEGGVILSEFSGDQHLVAGKLPDLGGVGLRQNPHGADQDGAGFFTEPLIDAAAHF